MSLTSFSIFFMESVSKVCNGSCLITQLKYIDVCIYIFLYMYIGAYTYIHARICREREREIHPGLKSVAITVNYYSLRQRPEVRQ